MPDHATPNLPARDFEVTEQFYSQLGFETAFKSDGWMILRNGGAVLEFFPFPVLDPAESNFSCCIRVDDLEAWMTQIRSARIPEHKQGIPRIVAPRREPSGLTIAYLVDPDGSLLRLVQNPPT